MEELNKLDFDDELYISEYNEIIYYDDCAMMGATFLYDECCCDCIGGEC